MLIMRHGRILDLRSLAYLNKYSLVASVVQHVTQFHGDLSPVHTNVFIGLTKRPSPLPSLVKHLAVQISHKTLIQQIAFFLT